MGRGLKIAGITIGLVFGVIIVLVLGIVAVFNLNDHKNRDFIAHRLDNFQVPQGCSESSREYQKSDIDASSTWSIAYSCHTTGGQAYDQIAAHLTSRNFVLHGDFSTGNPIAGAPAKAIFYNFTYWGNGVVAEYNFLPNTEKSVNDKAALRSSPVTSISLSVSKL